MPTYWQRNVIDRIAAQLTQGITVEKIALTIAVGPAGLLGLTSDLRGGAWLDIEHPAGGLSLRLFLLGSSRSATSAIFDGSTRGQITAQSLLGGFAVGPCLSGWSRSCASLFFGGRGTIGSSSGPQLFASESVLIVQPELGLLVAMEHELGAGFSLRLTLLAGASPGSAQFQIAGGPSRQLSTFDLAAALLLGYRIF